MRVKITRLKEKLKPYKKVVLYGAGNIAQLMLNILKENGIVPEFCVVSQKDKAKIKVNDICVYELDRYTKELQSDDIIVIVAVTKLYEREIEETLKQKDISNYICFTNYTGNEFSVYRNMTQKEYLGEVAEWYVDTNHLSLENIELIVKYLQDTIKQDYHKDKVVLVVGNLSPRVLKIAGALKKKGYTVETLCYLKGWLNETFVQKLKKTSDFCLFCDTIEELMYHLICSNSKVAHVFSNMHTSVLVHVLLNRKELFPKIVFDQYDIANGMYPFMGKEIYEEEKFCLEHVEGLVCRGYEQEYLIGELGYKISGQVIQFFDFCEDREINERIIKDGTELSLCYAGGLVAENEWVDASYFRLLEYAKLCEKEKCHLHVYPSVWNEQGFKSYILLDKKSKYFHFHKPIPYETLIEELSQYDYGIGLLFQRSLAGRETDGFYTKEKFIYAACNHFYDYLDAGLPIISAVPVKASQYFKGKGVLLDWALEDYDFEELKNRRGEFRNNVRFVKEELRIGKHIQELTEFYDLLFS